MPPELNSVLSVAIPSFIAVVGSIIAAIYVRRSNREQNDTNAFQAVTDQLFKLNGELRTDLTEVKHKVIALEAAVAAKDAQIERLETDLEDTGSKWREQLSISRRLANYIKLLITAWPSMDVPPPAPDPPFDWEAHL